MDTSATRLDPPATRRVLVPVKEAAARLGLSESDVRRRIKAGTLPAEQFDRPQGTYYRVIFAAPTDASTTCQDQPDTRPDVPATRPDASPGIDALVTLVTSLTGTIERQAQMIAELREDRGRLQAHAEYASARVETLTAELTTLTASQQPVETSGATDQPASTQKPFWLFRRSPGAWVFGLLAIVTVVVLLAWPG